MTPIAPVPLSASGQSSARGLLIFGVGREEYAVDIALVQELRGYVAPTELAGAPDYLKGVLNLRGVIVPLIDLRIHFGNAQPAYDSSTVVIVLILQDAITGIVVDSVADVLWLAPNQLKPAPALSHANADYVTAVACIDERMPIVLDIQGLLRRLGCGALPMAA